MLKVVLSNYFIFLNWKIKLVTLIVLSVELYKMNNIVSIEEFRNLIKHL